MHLGLHLGEGKAKRSTAKGKDLLSAAEKERMELFPSVPSAKEVQGFYWGAFTCSCGKHFDWGGRGRRTESLRPDQAKLVRPYLK
jgi:hypothetical protein